MYGILKDIFSLQQKQTQNRKLEKSVEICKLWLFSVMISKLNGKTNKQNPQISLGMGQHWIWTLKIWIQVLALFLC